MYKLSSYIMPFKRPWDSCCPRIWDQWEVDGTRYVVQDLPPEDDEVVVQLLLENFLIDEPMCFASGTVNDKISVRSWIDLWWKGLSERMLLACYAEKHGSKVMVGVNCCSVFGNEKTSESKLEGEAFANMINAMSYVQKKIDCHKYLGTDKLLRGLSLLVKKEFRKANIGTRIVNAREPLCRAYGIKGSCTIFTSVGAQRCAERAGFTTLIETSWKELADAGLKYPRDEGKVVKLMVKKYD